MSDRAVTAAVFGGLIFGVAFNLWMWLGFGYEYNAAFAGVCAAWLISCIALEISCRRSEAAWREHMRAMRARDGKRRLEESTAELVTAIERMKRQDHPPTIWGR